MTSQLPYINWRNGRPRFVPGPHMRKAGLVGQDLRHPDGKWFTREEALTFSDHVRIEGVSPIRVDQISLSLPSDLVTKLRSLARASAVPMQTYIERVLEAHTDNNAER